MLEQTTKIKQRYDELTKLVIDPEVIANNKRWQKLVKERSSIEEIANCHDALIKLQKNLEDSKNILKVETDPEMIEVFKEDVLNTEKQFVSLMINFKYFCFQKMKMMIKT